MIKPRPSFIVINLLEQQQSQNDSLKKLLRLAASVATFHLEIFVMLTRCP